MTRPYFDVVGVFLASAVVGLLGFMGVIFFGVKLGFGDRLLQALYMPAAFLPALVVWRWFQKRHEQKLLEFERLRDEAGANDSS